MKQLTLDVRPAPRPSFENFVAGANAELLMRLRGLHEVAAGESIYLWGATGSGRSHLLQAAVAAYAKEAKAVYIRASEVREDLPAEEGLLLAIDDVEQLAPAAQIALFRCHNLLREKKSRLLLSASAPPLKLNLREDLRTRLGQALIFEVKPLTDEEKAATLATHAHNRGMRIAPELVNYLLRHVKRDLPSLMAVLDALDDISLEQKRPLTLPLLRDTLENLFS